MLLRASLSSVCFVWLGLSVVLSAVTDWLGLGGGDECDDVSVRVRRWRGLLAAGRACSGAALLLRLLACCDSWHLCCRVLFVCLFVWLGLCVALCAVTDWLGWAWR